MTPRISAALITRSERAANVPAIIDRILACPAVGEVLLARDPAERVSARWRLARKAAFDLVYFQDDDCLVDVGELLAAYDEHPGVPVCRIARTHWGFIQGQVYNTWSGVAQLGMVGWGALFPWARVDAVLNVIDRNFGFQDLPLLDREADRIATLLCPELRLIDGDVESLPGASAPHALSREPDHAEWRARAIARALAIRNDAA